MNPQTERSLELLVELLRAGPLTAPEIDGEVRYRWSAGTWPRDRFSRPLTVPHPVEHAGQGYGRLYELLGALETAGRVCAFTDPFNSGETLWNLVKAVEAA